MTPEDRERFWSVVQKAGDDECWLWQNCPTANGYGKMSIDDTEHYAHRLAYAIANDDPGDHLVLHDCGNKLCVNPAHLKTGDRGDNQRDAERLGEWNSRGEADSQAKLTHDEAAEVRRRARGDETNAEIANEFGVSPSLVSRIKNGRRWSE